MLAHRPILSGSLVTRRLPEYLGGHLWAVQGQGPLLFGTISGAPGAYFIATRDSGSDDMPTRPMERDVATIERRHCVGSQESELGE
jgi:hypothetical protein